MLNHREAQELVDILTETLGLDHMVTIDYVDQKDFSILENFTDEELANELCRRTALGKELE